ncbi:TonB-dependent siderophore receptor [Pseudomonas sp. StFLB209]|uniref:TonB-dependent siderophore receptor n=1 Tax=Pseudomonas sp. StFLB209 TaxID=1028989 RepID=UPI0004F8BCFE|nr:TonB-dependent receptor [Pseudomonas sp. StFLB209]BAP45848.1 TonB-dependent siderophore receptor [Pseudomonas sp. StFLB209]
MPVPRVHLFRPASSRWPLGWLLGCALLSTAAQVAAEQRQRYDQPAQSLAGALGAFGAQSGIQVSFDAELARDLRAPALKGVMSEQDALRQLLQDSGLGWSLTPERTLLLFRQPAEQGALNLAPSTIHGSAQVETAAGPVQGYRATRTATASKTDTALRDIPQSVQVVPRQVIEDQQLDRLGDVLANVSSVQRGNSHGGSSESFVIRGFHATGYAVDGMPLNPLASRPEALSDLANVERVEVLKGPASVLYGRGNPGGLINLVTRKPSFTPQASAKLQAGSGDFYRLQASASGALNPAETLAGRLTVATQTDRGFRDTLRDSKHSYIAPALRWQPSDSTRVDTGLEYIDQSSPFDRGAIPVNGKINLPADRYLHEPWARDKADKFSLWYRAEHDLNDWLSLRQMTRWDDSHKDRYVVDLRGLASDGRTLNRRATDGEERIRTLDMQFEAIARFATGAVQHTALAGFEYIDGQRDTSSYRASLASLDVFSPVYGATPGRFAFQERVRYDLQSYSLYLQNQIEFNEQWELLLGARYDDTRQTSKALDADDLITRTDVEPEQLSPRVGVVWQPEHWLALYASYSTSFSPQTAKTRTGRVLDPEQGVQYEVGAKFDIIPEQLSATLAAFEIVRENVAASDPSDSEYAVQTGEQRVRGVELDVTGNPLPGWQIIGNLSALNAEVTQDTVIAEGNRLTGVPTLSGSLWSSYQLQEGRLRGLGFAGGVIFAGQREGDLDNSYDVGGYARFDAGLFYDLNEHVRLSLNGRNLTDRKYIETVAGTDGNYYGEPAHVLASLSLSY